MDMTVGQNTVSGRELLSLVERIEVIRKAKAELSDDEKVIMAEAKAAGFVPRGIRYLIKVREQKPQDWQEWTSLRDMYLHAVGLAMEPPLFKAMGLVTVDPLAKESVVEGLKKFAPQDGDIIVRIGKQPLRIYRDKEGEPQVEDYVEPKTVIKYDKPDTGNPNRPAEPRAKAEVPDVDDAGAFETGRQYARDNRPVIDNPFPFGDLRRAKFDEGWRRETGSDGMGPDDHP